MASNLEMKREDPVHLSISLARDGVDVSDRNNSLESKNNKAVGRTDRSRRFESCESNARSRRENEQLQRSIKIPRTTRFAFK